MLAGLWAAKSAEALAAAGVGPKLQRAKDLLSYIDLSEAPEDDPEVLLLALQGFGFVVPWPKIIELAFTPATPALIKKVSGRIFDVGVALVVAGATLITGYAALGIDDTWGTTGDYLKVIAATIVAPSVGLAGLTAANKLRLLRADPMVADKAKPAS